MPYFQLHTSNEAEEIYTGKHVELIVTQDASTETAHFITKQENYVLSHWHLQGT
jgi:TusA-related sulfurtransferase